MPRKWDTVSCLFCYITSEDFDANVQHMTDVHDLSIPDLAVEFKTLLSYCYVVINSYHKCLVCGIRRQTVKLLQAHMRDKKHCGFSIEDESSDFRAFYDFEGTRVDGIDDSGEKDARTGGRWTTEVILWKGGNE